MKPEPPPPLYGTEPKAGAASHGPQLAQIAELMGLELFGWQRLVADVALERSDIGYRYRTVGVSVGRQNGKTAFAAARIALELLSGRQSAYTAQDRGMARVKWGEAVDLMRPAFGARFVEERRANGSERLEFLGGGSFSVITPSQDGGRGLTLDLVVVDEAMAHHDMSIVSALGPTMATRPSAQMWLLSNAGDERSALLRHYRDLGRSGGADRLCWFEWAAAEGADPDDEETWAAAIPTLHESHGVALEAVRDFHQHATGELFDREMLNRWPLDAGEQLLDAAHFVSLENHDQPHGDRLSLGVDVSPSRDWASIAIASRSGGLTLVEISDHREGASWVADRVRELAGRWGAQVVIDGGAAAGSLLPRLGELDVMVLNGRDFAGACASFYDAVCASELCHLGDPLLVDGVAGATRVRRGDRWAWSRKTSGPVITPLCAASLALWGTLSPATVQPAPRVF